MIERSIQRLLEHPRGRIYVIFASLTLALVLIVPVADEYSDLIDQQDKLARQLATAESLTGNVDGLQQRMAVEQARLAEYERQMVPAAKMPSFRGHLVDLIRESECQLRKITVGAVSQRHWQRDDHPLAPTEARKKVSPKNQTGYDLGSQRVMLSVSGSLTEIRTLLARLHEQEYLSHTKYFVIRPENRQQGQVLLELDLLLFSLKKSQENSA